MEAPFFSKPAISMSPPTWDNWYPFFLHNPLNSHAKPSNFSNQPFNFVFLWIQFMFFWLLFVSFEMIYKIRMFFSISSFFNFFLSIKLGLSSFNCLFFIFLIFFIFQFNPSFVFLFNINTILGSHSFDCYFLKILDGWDFCFVIFLICLSWSNPISWPETHVFKD